MRNACRRRQEEKRKCRNKNTAEMIIYTAEKALKIMKQNSAELKDEVIKKLPPCVE